MSASKNLQKSNRAKVDEHFGITVHGSTVHGRDSYRAEVWTESGETILMTGWHHKRDDAVDAAYEMAFKMIPRSKSK